MGKVSFGKKKKVKIFFCLNPSCFSKSDKACLILASDIWF